MIKIHAKREIIENLPAEIFFNLGLDQIAYVTSSEEEDGRNEFIVHKANGEEISSFRNQIEAIDFLKDNNLMPITVH